MIEPYIEAVRQALGGIVELLTRLALPLAIGLGLATLAVVATLIFARDSDWLREFSWRRRGADALGYAAVGVLLIAGWAALRVVKPLAQQDIHWRESAQATTNPTPDAPTVYQYGPALAVLTERTYTRTLRLPAYFLNRIGAEGVGVLAPYLTDPSAENVIRLRDQFRRSGREVVFTREATLLDEEPLPFTNSQIQTKFRRLPGRAYDLDFDGKFLFDNPGEKPETVHFVFNLPRAGTIRDLKITVDGEAVPEPTTSAGEGAYEWKGELKPGEKREALVHYSVLGARLWSYDLGSQRRRVRQFQLDAQTGGPAKFLRGSLQPTSQDAKTLRWQLADVVTAQQVAIVFPPDSLSNQLYLQALSALPASFVLFLLGVLLLGWCFGSAPAPSRLLAGLFFFAFGLGASAVAAIYLGTIAGVLLGPLLGAALATLVLGRRSLLAGIPAALLPATFLSAQNSGLLIVLLTLATIAMIVFMRRQPNSVRG